MRELRAAELRWVGWGVVSVLLIQAGVLWLRKDPLHDVVTTPANSTSIAPSLPEPTQETVVPLAPVPRMIPGMIPGMGPGMIPGMIPGMGPGMPAPALPAAVQARVERITQSEILGPVMHPLPMALLGIAGEDAFLRAPNGQTGLLRVGEEMGGIRLLRIGTNRVLIEHEQQQVELTLFAGFGGDALLPAGATMNAPPPPGMRN